MAGRRPTRRGEAAKKPYPKRPKEVVCPDCSKTRTVKGTHRTTRRCKDCQSAKMRKGQFKPCEHCGTDFWVIPKRLSTARFCSPECFALSGYRKTVLGPRFSLARGGDGNPSYKHGRRIGIQIPGWKLNNKGEKKCRNCGANGRGENGRLELHHAIPRSKARHVKADLRNGVPLCQVCHTGWHGKRVAIYRDIFTEDEWAFISSVKLTGENIGAWLDKHYPARPLEAAA